MDGKSLHTQSNFVGAAVLTAGKVAKSVKDYKASQLPKKQEPTGTIKVTADVGKKQTDEAILIVFVAVLVLAAFYIGRKVK